MVRRFLAVKWLVEVDQDGKERKHMLKDYGIQNEVDERENAYIMEIAEGQARKFVPVVQMPQGMRWRNVSNRDD